MIQPSTLLADPLHHVVPDSVGADGVALLTQVHAVDRHDGQVRLDVVLVVHARVFEERLVDNCEVVGVKIGKKADALHYLHEPSLELSEKLTIARKFLSKQT